MRTITAKNGDIYEICPGANHNLGTQNENLIHLNSIFYLRLV